MMQSFENYGIKMSVYVMIVLLNKSQLKSLHDWAQLSMINNHVKSKLKILFCFFL